MVISLFLALAAAPADWSTVVGPLAAQAIADAKNAAVVVGVYDGGATHVYGFGRVTTRTGRQAPDGRTVFAVGSITKAFTGLLLADAARRKEVSLAAPANDYLPKDLGIRPRGDGPVTLEDLATHSSGLPVQPVLLLAMRDPKNPYADFTREKLATELGLVKPSYPPGKKYRYSNLGAGLVGEALVHTAKAADYDRLLKVRICDPLGMRDTAEALTGDQLSRLAPGFTDKGEPGPHWDFASLSACGGLKSTADDLLKLGAAVAGGEETPLRAVIADAVTPRRDADSPARRIGLFWMTTAAADKPPAVWHNGATSVTHAVIWAVPGAKRAVVVLANRGEIEVEALAEKIAAAATGPRR